jgi:membrane protein EpsK
MDKRRRLITNTLVNVIQTPLGTIVQLFLTPFVLNTLGKPAYGIWTLTGSLLAYFAQLRAGLNSAVSYHVPRHHERKDIGAINRVVSTVFAFYSVITVIGACFVAIFVWRFPIWFNVPDDLRVTSRWVVLIAGFGVLVTVLTSVYAGVLAGLQRYDVVAGSRVGLLLVRALGIVVIISIGIGLIGLAGVSVAIECVTAVWIVFASYKFLPGLRVRRAYVDMKLLPGLMAYSTSSLMFGSGQLIMSQAGKILVGLLYTPAAVTDFSVPFVLLVMVGSFVLSLTRAIKPMATLLDTLDEGEKVRRLFLLSTKYSMMIAIPVAVSCLLFGEEVLRAWIGPSYGGPGGMLLSLMAVPQMLRVSQIAGYYVVTGLGKHRYFGMSILVQAVSGLLLAFVLAKPFGLGLMGVAIGISIPEVIGCGYFIPRYCCRTLGLRVRDELIKSAIPAAVSTLPVTAYLLVVHQFMALDSRPVVASVFGIAVLFWVAGVFFLGLARDERTDFIGVLLKRGRGGKGKQRVATNADQSDVSRPGASEGPFSS